jgi:hypothetical protein
METKWRFSKKCFNFMIAKHDHNIGFQGNRQFFSPKIGQNRRKRQALRRKLAKIAEKNVIITLTPDKLPFRKVI